MVVSLSGTVAKLEAQVIALTEEIARLKDLKGRPKLKPSGLEKGTDPCAPGAPGARPPRRKRRGRNKTPPRSARLIVDEDRVIQLTPELGWRFKGYKRYTVQDLVIEVRVVRYLLSQHYQCRVMMLLLHQQLQDIGLLISAGQIPGQRKTQREGLALLVATMLDVRSANLSAETDGW